MLASWASRVSITSGRPEKKDVNLFRISEFPKRCLPSDSVNFPESPFLDIYLGHILRLSYKVQILSRYYLR